FPSCHASTVVQTEKDILAAWFGGTSEGDKDVGIWLSRLEQGKWTTPVEITTGVQTDGTRFPCWNPVLFRTRGGKLTLFYKVGPSPSRWWGEIKTSNDGGHTWSKGEKLP